jgi:hypothetical protein
MAMLAATGIAAAALGALMVACAPRGTPPAPRPPATRAALAPEPPKPPAVIDVGRMPWMQWNDGRPDPARGRIRTDPTAAWSDAAALETRAPISPVAAPATREAIPKPVEPASRVEDIPPLPEPREVSPPK